MTVAPKKGLFSKQVNIFNTNMSCRRSSEKNRFHKTINIAFNPDPLNLSALCNNRKDGNNDPVSEILSPNLNRSHHFEPGIIQPLDMKDPLNLNIEDESLIKAVCRRKKRKRRNTGGTLTETEELLIISNSIANDHLDKSDSILPEPTAKKIETDRPSSEDKIEQNGGKQHLIESVERGRSKNKICKYNQKRQLSFSDKNSRYRYGNYIDFNDGLRKNMVDHRLNYFMKDWFERKHCLDIGCNTGKVTILIAKHFMPTKIVGIDIDPNLIKIAKRKAQEYSMASRNISKYPTSFSLTYGPILAVQLDNKGHDFPDNLFFYVDNFVPESAESLELVKPEFECILCLNVTKWIQLNFGDSGLKLVFKKIFLLLKPGGRLLLEVQSYNSYRKKKHMVSDTWKHFTEMKFMPADFVTYLLSSEVGFARSEILTYSRKDKTGYDHPLYLLVKSDSK